MRIKRQVDPRHSCGDYLAPCPACKFRQYCRACEICTKCGYDPDDTKEKNMPDIFVKVDLLTRKGDLVTTVKVPPWTEGNEPEAYLWGQRTFFRRPDGRYTEGFFYVIPLGSLEVK